MNARTNVPSWARRLSLGAVSLGAIAVAALFAPSREANAFPPPPPTHPGDPLPGLSTTLRSLFDDGKTLFQHELTPEEGLGPIYNQKACQTCHGSLGGTPGGSDVLGVGSTNDVTHIGFDNRGYYDPLRYLGGPLLEVNSIHDDGVPGCPLLGETVPSKANIISHRHTPPVLGFGLIDAIPDDEIRAYENLGIDGIHGFANWGVEMQALDTEPTPFFPPIPVYGAPRVGRFGWKAQTATLAQFSAEPFNTELGATTPFFPQEHSPVGVRTPAALPAGCEVATTNPNDVDASRAYALYHFQALLAPPPRLPPTPKSILGETLFFAFGCQNCHRAEMVTASEYDLTLDGVTSVRVPELENQVVHLYSDLLVHDMGPVLADDGGANVGRVMTRARGNHWRTTPLWGLRLKDAYLHDGRTTSIEEAILAHGGEATVVRNRFAASSDTERALLVEFLQTL